MPKVMLSECSETWAYICQVFRHLIYTQTSSCLALLNPTTFAYGLNIPPQASNTKFGIYLLQSLTS